MSHQKKKHFGQHFLKNDDQAKKIALSLKGWGRDYNTLLEIGPGEGMLSKHLVPLANDALHLTLVEIDDDLIPVLEAKFGGEWVSIHHGDFMAYEFNSEISCGVIGNFPYNISSQIVFAILENRSQVLEMVGMFQKEVAMRIAAPPGSKVYGILSVLVAAYYKTQIIMHLKPGAFHPPPKVDSTVIRLERWRSNIPGVDEKLFFKIVKAAFNQRRKTLRNSLKPLLNEASKNEIDEAILQRRPEELGFETFIELSTIIGKHWQ